jgi:hypothetical protein
LSEDLSARAAQLDVLEIAIDRRHARSLREVSLVFASQYASAKLFQYAATANCRASVGFVDLVEGARRREICCLKRISSNIQSINYPIVLRGWSGCGVLQAITTTTRSRMLSPRPSWI